MNPAGYNPLANYRSITRADTAAIMATEAVWYDGAIAADGWDAIIDIEPDKINAPGELLTVSICQVKPKINLQPRTAEKPIEREPNRTGDQFITTRNVEAYINQIGRGRTLKFDGQTFTISYLKPHRHANVTLYVEIHVDRNEGLSQPNAVGIL